MLDDDNTEKHIFNLNNVKVNIPRDILRLNHLMLNIHKSSFKYHPL